MSVKIYKNPARKNLSADYKPYIPQYQIEGRDPQKHNSAVVPNSSKVAKGSTVNPREKRVPFRQPYALATPSPIGRGPVPNVGNNMEHTWSSVDGDVIDDLSGEIANPDEPMVDNNDFVSDEAMGYQNGITAGDIPSQFKPQKVQIEEGDSQEVYEENNMPVQRQQFDSDTGDLFSIVSDLADESFLLIVAGTPLCSGPKEEIEEQARALVFGEHEICDGNEVPIDDIIILKKARVKVGLFLE
jgi:hypothetical protein